jgi:hypothetical protein
MALYSNRPGGTIAHTKDGTAKLFKYGEEVKQEELAEHVDASTFADDQPRLSQTDISLEQAREAARRSPGAEGGQVNSSQSPVPGNYSDFDEDSAALLVLHLSRYPEQQAEVIKHEILFGGNRQKVIDAAGSYAVTSAHARIAALLDTQKDPQGADLIETAPVTSPGDPGALPGDPGRTARLEQLADVTLGGDAVKSGSPPPTSGSIEQPNIGERGPVSGSPSSADIDRMLAEREQELEVAQADVERLRGQVENPSGDPAVTSSGSGRRSSRGQARGDIGPATDANEATGPEAGTGQPFGEARGFEGDGPGTDSYYTNDDLRTYAQQHDVEVGQSDNRGQLLKKLASAGHNEPQTPKS